MPDSTVPPFRLLRDRLAHHEIARGKGYVRTDVEVFRAMALDAVDELEAEVAALRTALEKARRELAKRPPTIPAWPADTAASGPTAPAEQRQPGVEDALTAAFDVLAAGPIPSDPPEGPAASAPPSVEPAVHDEAANPVAGLAAEDLVGGHAGQPGAVPEELSPLDTLLFTSAPMTAGTPKSSPPQLVEPSLVYVAPSSPRPGPSAEPSDVPPPDALGPPDSPTPAPPPDPAPAPLEPESATEPEPPSQLEPEVGPILDPPAGVGPSSALPDEPCVVPSMADPLAVEPDVFCPAPEPPGDTPVASNDDDYTGPAAFVSSFWSPPQTERLRRPVWENWQEANR